MASEGQSGWARLRAKPGMHCNWGEVSPPPPFQVHGAQPTFECGRSAGPSRVTGPWYSSPRRAPLCRAGLFWGGVERGGLGALRGVVQSKSSAQCAHSAPPHPPSRRRGGGSRSAIFRICRNFSAIAFRLSPSRACWCPVPCAEVLLLEASGGHCTAIFPQFSQWDLTTPPPPPAPSGASSTGAGARGIG